MVRARALSRGRDALTSKDVEMAQAGLCLCVCYISGGVRARFRERFQAVKVRIFGGFPLGNLFV